MLKKSNEQLQEIDKFQKLLGNAEDTRIVNLIQQLSPNGEMVRRRNEFGMHLERNKLTKEYGIRCFSEEEILDECRKYDLAIMNSRQYRGDYDLEFIRKIDVMIKESNLNKVDGDSYSNSFFIAGKAKRRVKMDDMETFADGKVRMAFYKVPGENYYAMLTNNSYHINLLSIYRGFRHRSEGNLRFTMFMENLVVCAALIYWWQHAVGGFGIWGYLGTGVLAIIVSFITMLIRMAAQKSSTSDMNHNPDYFLESLKIRQPW